MLLLLIIGSVLLSSGVYAFLSLQKYAKGSEMNSFHVTVKLFGRNISCGLVFYGSAVIVALGIFIIFLSCAIIF